MHPIVAFYRGTERTSAGACYSEIIGWDFAKLERIHDYIQWIFPLYTASSFEPNAPRLDAEAVQVFRNEAKLRENLIGSLRVMLNFYGLECDDDDPEDVAVYSGGNFNARRSGWISAGNHNYPRITRILQSLQILGCVNYAVAFHECLHQLAREYGGAFGSALSHWDRAVNRTNAG